MRIYEPQRWVELLQKLHSVANSSAVLFDIVAFFADGFIFLIPLFLLIVYVLGIKNNNKIYKEYALRVFTAPVVVIIINIIFQSFLIKDRPETALENSGGLILAHLPTMSFPSDHAAVGMAFAIAVIAGAHYVKSIKTHKKQQKIFLRWGVVFLICLMIMAICRVMVGIHRPTDIIVWWLLGISAGTFVYHLPQWMYNAIIRMEEYICKKICNIKSKWSK